VRSRLLFVLLAALLTQACGSSGAGATIDLPASPPPPPPPPPADMVTVTIGIEGAGMVADSASSLSCASSCSASVSRGTSLTLSATADNGYDFDGWSGACAGAGACSLTANASVSIGARFVANTAGNPSGDSLFVNLPDTGSVVVTLHPGSQVTLGSTTTVAFGVPFPKDTIGSVDLLRVTDLAGNEIPSFIRELTRWRMIQPGTPESLRAALFYIDVVFADRAPRSVRVEYGTAHSQFLPSPSAAVTSTWTSISNGENPGEYPAADDVREPMVYATLPATWLTQALLVTRTTPARVSASLGWWDSAMINYAGTAVNDVAPTVLAQNRIDLLDSEPWLYDRALALFSVYIRTGDVKWLRRSHRAAQWYGKKVDANGIFSLASYNHDLKYSYGSSLLVDYLLTGDEGLRAPIDRIAGAGVTEWETTYGPGVGFWTERHHTYALLAALAAFELDGDRTHATRATALVNLILQMSQNAAQCPLHTVTQHEGDANDFRMMCSPWMGALLGQAMLRYYMLAEDPDVLLWLSGMGDFVRRYAVYDGGIEHNELAGLMMPWYLVGPGGQIEDGRGWDDMEHACDVAGLMAKSVWAKRRLGLNHVDAEATADALLETCQFVLDYWHRSAPELAEYRLSPPRKFSWWFGSSTDLGWMLGR